MTVQEKKEGLKDRPNEKNAVKAQKENRKMMIRAGYVERRGNGTVR